MLEPEWTPWGPDSPGYPNCPVEPGTDCEVRLRDMAEGRSDNPQNWRWRHVDLGGDIIAYRVWPAKDDARALLAITAATGAIFERMAGGKIDWRNADDDLLQSADWLTAQEYARAAIDAYLERNR